MSRTNAGLPVVTETYDLPPDIWQRIAARREGNALSLVKAVLDARGRRTVRDVLTDLLDYRDPYVREAAMMKLGEA
jgi:hypothetical protein